MARTTVEDRLQNEVEKIEGKIRSAMLTVEELKQERERLIQALGALRGTSQ